MRKQAERGRAPFPRMHSTTGRARGQRGSLTPGLHLCHRQEGFALLPAPERAGGQGGFCGRAHAMPTLSDSWLTGGNRSELGRQGSLCGGPRCSSLQGESRLRGRRKWVLSSCPQVKLPGRHCTQSPAPGAGVCPDIDNRTLPGEPASLPPETDGRRSPCLTQTHEGSPPAVYVPPSILPGLLLPRQGLFAGDLGLTFLFQTFFSFCGAHSEFPRAIFQSQPSDSATSVLQTIPWLPTVIRVKLGIFSSGRKA